MFTCVSSWAQLHPIFFFTPFITVELFLGSDGTPSVARGLGHGPVKTHTCEHRFPLFTVQVQVRAAWILCPIFLVQMWSLYFAPLTFISFPLLFAQVESINCKSACQQYSPQSNCAIVYIGPTSESQANNLLEGGSQSMGNPWWRGQSWVKTFLKVCKGVWNHSPVWWDQGWSVWAKVQELHLEKSSSTVHTTSGRCSSSPPSDDLNV